MPCATVHLEAARSVLDGWTTGRVRGAPFDPTDAELRELFFHGALGPDMGYVPGVDRFVSDLAHYVRGVDLARALVARAGTAREVAYAWGWANHVLADVLIHPLVGRACGEILYGSRELRLNSGAHLGLHVAVEVGLDATILASRPDVPTPPRRPVLGSEEGRGVSEALASVYHLEWDPAFLLDSFRRAIRVTRRWPLALRMVTAPWGGADLQPVTGVLDALRDGAGRILVGLAGRLPSSESPARGLLRPLRPAQWLVDAVVEITESFPERFQPLVDGGLERMANHNLENGISEGSGVQHPAALQTRLLLEGLLRGERPRTPGLVGAG